MGVIGYIRWIFNRGGVRPPTGGSAPQRRRTSFDNPGGGGAPERALASEVAVRIDRR